MFLFCLVFAMSLRASVYMCFVVTCWEKLTSWLSFVVSNCEFVTFPLVSWIRCGSWLYRFLIFASLLTLHERQEDFFHVAPNISLCKTCDPGAGPILAQGSNLNKLGRG